MRKTAITMLNVFFFTALIAQLPCPTFSLQGIHVVQQGETLSSISRKYNVPVAQIAQWNNMGEEDILQICTELKVATNVLVVVAQKTPTSYNIPIVASKSVVEPFRDDFSDPIAETYTQEEVQYDNIGTPNYRYFEKSPYLPFYHIVSNNETPTSVGKLYGLSTSEVVMMNNLMPNAPLTIGQKLLLEDRNQTRYGTYTFDRNNFPARMVRPRTSVPPSYNKVARPQAPPQEDVEVNSKSVQPPKSPASDKSGNTSMTPEEQDMVKEINLVRSNPAGYIPYIQEYIEYLQKNGSMGNAIPTANELIAELKRTLPLSVLHPLQCVYTAAKKHGEEQKRRGDTDHQGSDGSWPWDRVKRECPDLQDGNENLVGGPASVRRAVILLLVDDGIETRGHRKTMLNPDWRYVACYKIGTVGNMPNCWVQNYGY